MKIEKTSDYNVVLYQLQKEAILLDANNLLLINDPSDELLGIAFRSHYSKVINGEYVMPLNGNTFILKIKYESNILKERMMNKRNFINSINFILEEYVNTQVKL
jgi:hypothetical protein